ncbi:MAG: DUF3795 domain-containing protein [Promethearchaeati archaeon]
MEKKKLVARCGLWCGACRAYLLKKKDMLEEKGYKRGCNGCWIQDKNCAFLRKKCEKLGNNIDFCFECEELPCAALKTLNDTYMTRYNVNLVENLKRMKQIGIDEWIKEQENLYICPECGGDLCLHDKECFDCGYKFN